MIGLVNTCIHGIMLIGCVEIWGLAVVLSHFISFSIANVISFFLNSFYTFRRKISLLRYAKFWFASIISLGMTLSLSWMFNEFGFHYMAGFLIIAIVVPLASFLMMKFWAFKKKEYP